MSTKDLIAKVCKIIEEHKTEIATVTISFSKIVKKIAAALIGIIKLHTVAVIAGVVAVACLSAGVLVGRYIGYIERSSEFRHEYADVYKDLINECGSNAVYVTLKYIKSDPIIYKRLMSSPKEACDICNEVSDLYFKSPKIREFLISYT